MSYLQRYFGRACNPRALGKVCRFTKGAGGGKDESSAYQYLGEELTDRYLISVQEIILP